MAGFSIPGPLGVTKSESFDDGTMCLCPTPTPGPIIGVEIFTKSEVKEELDGNTRILAATAYGEGSTQNVFEEMAAIANVLVRQQKARDYSSIESLYRLQTQYLRHRRERCSRRRMVARRQRQ